MKPSNFSAADDADGIEVTTSLPFTVYGKRTTWELGSSRNEIDSEQGCQSADCNERVLVLGDERDAAAEAAARHSYKGKYKAKGKFIAMFILWNPCFYCQGMYIYKYSYG